MKLYRRFSVVACTALFLAAATASWAQYQDEGPFCQILDRTTDPIWSLYLGYTERGDVKATGGDDFALIDTGAKSGLLYLRTDYGDFDISANLELRVVSGDGGVDMPDQFGHVSVDAAWIQRYLDGWASLVEVSPGLYTDYEDLGGDDFHIPFGLSLIKAFHDQASGQVGLRIFPDFDRSVDPVIGLRWEVSSNLLLDLFYPDSRLLYTVHRDLDVYAGFRIREFSEYQLEEDDARDRFMIRETRVFLGIDRAMSDTVRSFLEIGSALEREIEFDGPGGDADVDDAIFVRVGLGGVI